MNGTERIAAARERSEVKWSRSAVESVVESALGSREKERRMRMERGARRSVGEREKEREREWKKKT